MPKVTLATKLLNIRRLKSQGAGFEVRAMYEILALERASVLWRRDGTETFAAVLKAEPGMCTQTRFKAFKKAAGLFSQDTIEKLGVPCVCLLAKQSQSIRTKLLKPALAYRKKHGSEPAYQYIALFLRKPGTSVSRARLSRYIEVLTDVISHLGGVVPVME